MEANTGTLRERLATVQVADDTVTPPPTAAPVSPEPNDFQEQLECLEEEKLALQVQCGVYGALVGTVRLTLPFGHPLHITTARGARRVPAPQARARRAARRRASSQRSRPNRESSNSGRESGSFQRDGYFAATP